MEIVPHNFVAPRNTPDIPANEQTVLAQSAHVAGQVMASRPHTNTVLPNDTAVTMALGNVIYSVAYAVAGLFIMGGIFLMMWLSNCPCEDGGKYFVWFLIAWGVCVLCGLAVNKWQGLRHSPAGIAHHEIESRERVAYYMVDRHIELIEARWEKERER